MDTCTTWPFYPQQDTLEPTDWVAGWAPEMTGMFWKRDNSLVPATIATIQPHIKPMA